MTTSRLLDPYADMLSELATGGRKRSLRPCVGIDFASNDYLGLAGSPRLANAIAEALAAGTPVGATGSRLLRGNAPYHERLESDAARFFGAERALFFGGGYVANFAVLTTLPQRDDLLVLDELVHASANEGARAGRARSVKVTHNDVDAVEDAITTWRRGGGTGRPWIVAESIYSMDGDRAPLADYAAVADRHDAFLFVDEAHATGVFGRHGRGLADDLEGRDNIVVLHTCGKALGCTGALLTAPNVLCEFLVNRCRPFIYSTAPSPLMAAAVIEALAILHDEPERRARLMDIVAFVNEELRDRCGIAPSGSQILPVIVGSDLRAMEISAALRAKGFDVRGIRPPTVPDGTARLRLSITLNVDRAQAAAMVSALANELERTPT